MLHGSTHSTLVTLRRLQEESVGRDDMPSMDVIQQTSNGQSKDPCGAFIFLKPIISSVSLGQSAWREAGFGMTPIVVPNEWKCAGDSDGMLGESVAGCSADMFVAALERNLRTWRLKQKTVKRPLASD